MRIHANGSTELSLTLLGVSEETNVPNALEAGEDVLEKPGTESQRCYVRREPYHVIEDTDLGGLIHN